jgi:hypothetical protein
MELSALQGEQLESLPPNEQGHKQALIDVFQFQSKGRIELLGEQCNTKMIPLERATELYALFKNYSSMNSLSFVFSPAQKTIQRKI